MFEEKLRTRAVFIGQDWSMGYRTGETYSLEMWISGGKIWVDRGGWNGRCPYSSMKALLKNWKF